MKRILLMLVAVLGISSLALAQQRGGMMRMSPEERAKRSVEMLGDKLNLSESQKDSVYRISLDGAKEQQTLFQENSGGDRRELFSKMRSINENTQTKIRAVLTEEQQKTYDAVLKEQRERMENGRGRGN